LTGEEDCALAMSLRLAALFYRNRSDVALPEIQASISGKKFRIAIDPAWLESNPLTETALQDDIKQWKNLGISLQVEAE